jgi:hypothetical protein
MATDPEQKRIEELLGRSRTGEASDAEREELELYTRERPELLARVAAVDRERSLGEGWLQRVEADHRLKTVEAGARTRLERRVGLGLVVAGFVLEVLTPVIGGPVLGAGLLVLLYSYVRSRLREHKTDPYKDVVQ